MKIKGTTSNGLDLDKCYLGLVSEQHSRTFNHRSDTLGNANANGTITFKTYNS